jgi:hypothetical protein
MGRITGPNQEIAIALLQLHSMKPWVFLAGAILAILCGGVRASHFRFGTISYAYGGDAKKEPGKVTFRIQLGFRRSFGYAWKRASVGSSVSASGKFDLGDGKKRTSLTNLKCTALDVEADWIFMEVSKGRGAASLPL